MDNMNIRAEIFTVIMLLLVPFLYAASSVPDACAYTKMVTIF